jgi:hypothetical protein
VDVAAFINKNDELQAENVALVAHSNAVTLHVAELTSYSNAVVPLVNELQAQNAELTSYSNAIAPLIDQVQARSADVTAYSNLTRHSAYSNNVVARVTKIRETYHSTSRLFSSSSNQPTSKQLVK